MIIDSQQLGVLLRNTRRHQRLTQAELAATCGVGVRFIRELEQGKPTCQLGKSLHVLQMLGLRVVIE